MAGGVDRFSQSKKWRENLDRDLRVQMFDIGFDHFYIYEPVQLVSRKVVVPIYLYHVNTVKMSKCLHLSFTVSDVAGQYRLNVAEEPSFDSPTLIDVPASDFWRTYDNICLTDGRMLASCSDGSFGREYVESNLLNPELNCHLRNVLERSGSKVIVHPVRNPWREKANGMMIRHCPLTLYSDDTSGNVSKRWNKHMSYYFTLSGLPPKLSNQDFNCHFLATSNCASALELGDGIVDELK